MRVLLWHWGRRGGGPRYTFELARALARLPGMEVHLSLSRQSELFAITEALGLPGWHVHTYRGLLGMLMTTPRLPGLRRGFGRYLREARIDVVLCTMPHLWNPAIAGAIARAGSRYVLTVHDAEPHPGEVNALREAAGRHDIRLADHLLTLSDHVKTGLVRRHGLDPAAISVVPHGVFDYATPELKPAPASASGSAYGGPIRLLFFGRLLPYKGLSLLRETALVLRERGVDFRLTIAGQGHDPALAALARMPEVTLDQRWIDEAEIGALLAHHDVLVQPYVEASQSGVLPTALAAGLPAVVTPVGGLVEQVQHGRSGLVASAVTAAAMADCIGRLAAHPSLRQQLCAGARVLAAGPLSWEALAPRIADMLRGACIDTTRSVR
jgi:glycosyltransferase involved in cell wall biosynthesis